MLVSPVRTQRAPLGPDRGTVMAVAGVLASLAFGYGGLGLLLDRDVRDTTDTVFGVVFVGIAVLFLYASVATLFADPCVPAWLVEEWGR
jgi:hypothetical protein